MEFIENPPTVSRFLSIWDSEPSLIVPIWKSFDAHPKFNSILALYIRQPSQTWVLPIDRDDCLNQILDLSRSKQPKWVWNKKAFLHSNVRIENLVDIGSYYNSIGKKVDFKLQPNPEFYIKGAPVDNSQYGSIIPITKWIDAYDPLFKDLNWDIPTSLWMSNTLIPSLFKIEAYGICVNEKEFLSHYPDKQKLIHSGRVYTEYNPYTATGRPSNRHGGINYSSLARDGTVRSSFLPKEGAFFAQFDYDGFHPRIIGKILKQNMPKSSIHEWFSDQYGVDYDTSKAITFRILYGGVPPEYMSIDFFSKVDSFIKKLWESSIQSGGFDTLYRRMEVSAIEDPNPQKMFNYLIQALETELNSKMIEKILNLIHDTDIELNLYNYDSLLFSIPYEFDKALLSEIKLTMENGTFPVKWKIGSDYNLK